MFFCTLTFSLYSQGGKKPQENWDYWNTCCFVEMCVHNIVTVDAYLFNNNFDGDENVV